jgi:hypothetical protein
MGSFASFFSLLVNTDCVPSSAFIAHSQIIQDTVTAASKTVISQPILALTTLPSSFSPLPIDGVMGLAYRTLSTAYSFSFPSMVYQQSPGVASAAYVGIRLAKTSGKSQISIGGYNRAAVVGNLRWLAVTLEDTSQVRFCLSFEREDEREELTFPLLSLLDVPHLLTVPHLLVHRGNEYVRQRQIAHRPLAVDPQFGDERNHRALSSSLVPRKRLTMVAHRCLPTWPPTSTLPFRAQSKKTTQTGPSCVAFQFFSLLVFF